MFRAGYCKALCTLKYSVKAPYMISDFVPLHASFLQRYSHRDISFRLVNKPTVGGKRFASQRSEPTPNGPDCRAAEEQVLVTSHLVEMTGEMRWGCLQGLNRQRLPLGWYNESSRNELCIKIFSLANYQLPLDLTFLALSRFRHIIW